MFFFFISMLLHYQFAISLANLLTFVLYFLFGIVLMICQSFLHIALLSFVRSLILEFVASFSMFEYAILSSIFWMCLVSLLCSSVPYWESFILSIQISSSYLAFVVCSSSCSIFLDSVSDDDVSILFSCNTFSDFSFITSRSFNCILAQNLC